MSRDEQRTLVLTRARRKRYNDRKALEAAAATIASYTGRSRPLIRAALRSARDIARMTGIPLEEVREALRAGRSPEDLLALVERPLRIRKVGT